MLYCLNRPCETFYLFWYFIIYEIQDFTFPVHSYFITRFIIYEIKCLFFRCSDILWFWFNNSLFESLNCLVIHSWYCVGKYRKYFKIKKEDSNRKLYVIYTILDEHFCCEITKHQRKQKRSIALQRTHETDYRFYYWHPY